MELSAKVRYALIALLELARNYDRGKYLQIEHIAVEQQIPDRYLAQLFMTLRRGGIVRSLRGARGGYLLAKPPTQITVMEVIDCLEGTANQDRRIQPTSETLEISLLQEIWQEAQQAAMAVLVSYTLQDLCDKQDKGQQWNQMYYI